MPNNICVVFAVPWGDVAWRVVGFGVEGFATRDALERELHDELHALARNYATKIKWREPDYKAPRKPKPPGPMKRGPDHGDIFASDSEGSPLPPDPDVPEWAHPLQPHTSTAKRIARDVEEFMNERRGMGKEKDVLGWWARQMNRWPMVAAVARHTLCVPATSATSERAFSKTGHIVRAWRASLSDQNIERLTFLSWNADLL